MIQPLNPLVLNNHTFLSPEEMEGLAHIIANGTPKERAAAAWKIVECNQRWAVRFCSRYSNSGVPMDDLMQEARMALYHAALRFDPTKGAGFISYASYWMLKQMMVAVAKSKMIRAPSHVFQKVRTVAQARADYEDTHSMAPSNEQLAEWAEVPIETVRWAQELRSIVDLDAPLPGDTRLGVTSTVGDLIACQTTVDPSVEAESHSRASALHEALGNLTPREREVISRRHGFGEYNAPQALSEVSEAWGITKEGVRQAERRATKKLRFHLAALGVESFINS